MSLLNRSMLYVNINKAHSYILYRHKSIHKYTYTLYTKFCVGIYKIIPLRSHINLYALSLNACAGKYKYLYICIYLKKKEAFSLLLYLFLVTFTVRGYLYVHVYKIDNKCRGHKYYLNIDTQILLHQQANMNKM